jgi:hypothetical protein
VYSSTTDFHERLNRICVETRRIQAASQLLLRTASRLRFAARMERIDVERLADSVLRQYGVPLKIAGIASTGAEWTIAFAGTFPGAPAREIKLRCERASAYHVRESLKRGLELTD